MGTGINRRLADAEQNSILNESVSGEPRELGEYMWPDGSKYVGQFKGEKMHGDGKLHAADGKIYEGQFRNDKMEGRGVFTWPDGRVYSGHFKNN